MTLLSSILSLLQRYTTAMPTSEVWEFYERKCFEFTLNALGALESIPSSMPDVLEEDVSRWQKTLSKEASGMGGKYWASGTGFGTHADADKVWNREDCRAQRAKKEKVLSSLLMTLSHFLLAVSDSSDARFASVVKLLRCSPLLPFLTTNLLGLFESHTEEVLQHAVVHVASSLTRPAFREMVLNEFPFLTSLRKVSSLASKLLAGSTKFEEDESEAEITLALGIRDATAFLRYDMVFLLHEQERNRENQPKTESEVGQDDKGKEKEENLLKQYEEIFRDQDLLFGESDILSLSTFKYKSQAKSLRPKKSMLKRLLKEQASFNNVLPLHRSSSVFVRVDANQPAAMQAVITGPEGTPYAHGCFLFDIYCGEYPASPPKVNLSTTGHGAVRFNPNLYNCGKVCLSLIGTWEGRADEKWDSKMSTLLQLFVSIQSLIFVEEPYYNEPGYEANMKSESGKRYSSGYNKNIRKQTSKWAILDQLQNPPKGFEEVIKNHFILKKAEVLEQTKEWMKEHGDEGKDILSKVVEALGKI
jgi:ubiquitin-protein ligase